MLIQPDSQPPTVEKFSPEDGFLSVSPTTVITWGFSEPIQRGAGSIIIRESSGQVFALIAVNSTSLVFSSGKTVSISLSSPLAYSTTYFVDITAGAFTDLAGNPFAGLSTYDFTTVPPPDTIAPTITLQTSKTVLKAGDSALITFDLSELSTNFTEQDVAVSGGTLSGFAGSGAVYSATFTADAAGSVLGVVSVASGKFTDAAGNLNADGEEANNSVSVAIDTTPPTITVHTDNFGLKAGETATISFTLSEFSGNFTASDIAVSGGELTNFSGSGSFYTATLALSSIGMVPAIVTVPSGEFTDVAGNANADGSDENNTVTVVALNSAPTGALAVIGTVAQGEILTVSQTLADADGLGVLSYQWLVGGQPLEGATGLRFNLTQSHVGRQISVRASYWDQRGNAEFVTSPATAIVSNVNDAPIVGALSITTAEDTPQSGTLTATDIDSDPLSFSAVANPAHGTVVINPNGTYIYTPEPNYNGPDSFSFKANDGIIDSAAAAVSITVSSVNDAATGTVEITGRPGQGLTLNAITNIADVEDIPAGASAFSYQWFSGGSEIAGATTTALTITPEMVGRAISVRVSFTDLTGTPESLSSLPTAPAVSASLSGSVHSWFGTRPIPDVTISLQGRDAGDSGAISPTSASGDSGGWSIDRLDFDQFTLRAQKAVTAQDKQAVSAGDVVAALKIAHGRNPNPDPDGPGSMGAAPMSPYQLQSADLNRDSRVTGDDVLVILRDALDVRPTSAGSARWVFFDPAQDLSQASRASVSAPAPIQADADLATDMRLIGLLLGDVDGSWVPV